MVRTILCACFACLLIVACAGCARKGTLQVHQTGRTVDRQTVYWMTTQWPPYEAAYTWGGRIMLFRTTDPGAAMVQDTVTYVGNGGSFVLIEE